MVFRKLAPDVIYEMLKANDRMADHHQCAAGCIRSGSASTLSTRLRVFDCTFAECKLALESAEVIEEASLESDVLK